MKKAKDKILMFNWISHEIAKKCLNKPVKKAEQIMAGRFKHPKTSDGNVCIQANRSLLFNRK